jgi:hypothetical protein
MLTRKKSIGTRPRHPSRKRAKFITPDLTLFAGKLTRHVSSPDNALSEAERVRGEFAEMVDDHHADVRHFLQRIYGVAAQFRRRPGDFERFQVHPFWKQSGQKPKDPSTFETTLQLELQRDALREHDRTDRAEVVAFRLSGWLREVGSQIQKKSEAYDRLDGLPQPHQIVAQWKLNMAAGIESVMSDLHYLERGAGDVAKLDFHVKDFDACLDGLNTESLRRANLGTPIPYNATDLDRIYKSVGDRLKHMRQLHANAERHLNPILAAAVKRGR